MSKKMLHKIVDPSSQQSVSQPNSEALNLQLHIETDKLIGVLKDISARIETHSTRSIVHLDQVAEALKKPAPELKVSLPEIKVPEPKVVVTTGNGKCEADNKYIYIVSAILISPILSDVIKYFMKLLF